MEVRNNEVLLDETSLLVSETDVRGVIVYADEAFVKISGYALEELVGKNHNIIRHPDMPRAAFKEMWNTIKGGGVWQGFVKNRTKNGSFYWVYATIFPFGKDHYLSVRKKASREEANKYEAIYQQMRTQEGGQ